MVVGHIGARKGSKGVPNKNRKPLLGKPLFLWSLNLLLDLDFIDSIVVSTDDTEIYELSLSKGAADIGLRPSSLSGDDASKWSVWQHSLQAIKSLQNEEIEVFLDLDCTSPLRLRSDVIAAKRLFDEARPDMVMSCTEARKNPYFNLVEYGLHGGLVLSKQLESGRIFSRQKAPQVFEHVASIYVINPKFLENATEIYEGVVLPYIMPFERCWDVDEPIDFEIIEFLMRKQGLDR